MRGPPPELNETTIFDSYMREREREREQNMDKKDQFSVLSQLKI